MADEVETIETEDELFRRIENGELDANAAVELFESESGLDLSRLTDEELELLGEMMALAEVSEKPWSSFKEGDYSDSQWRRACLLDKGTGEGKSRYSLPVREPSGTLNKNALQAAASRINQVSASPEKKQAAAKKLASLYRSALNADPPENVTKLASGSSGGSSGSSQDSSQSSTNMSVVERMKDFFKQGLAILSSEEGNESVGTSQGDPSAFREASEGQEDSVELAAKKGDYTPEQWASATLIHTGKFDSPSKGEHSIPVRKPDGTLDSELMSQAATSLLSGNIDQEKKRRAARELMSLYREIDDNPPDSLKGLAGRMYEMDEASLGEEGQLAYQLPYELSEAKAVGKRLYRKTLAEVGRTIHYDGRVLDYSRSALQKWVDNFKAKAFPQVPLLSTHTKDVFAYLGELVDLALEGKKVVGTFRVTERAAKLLDENPRLNTSVGYLEDYVRKADKKRFGPTLQHIATTFMPHDHLVGLEPWEQIQMSVEAVDVVDLTESQYSTPTTRKESDPRVDATEVREEEVTEVTLEELQSQLAEERRAREAAEGTIEAIRLSDERKSRLLREQGVNRFLRESRRIEKDGKAFAIPKERTDAVKLLLDDLEGTENDPVTLSADGASFNEGALAKVIELALTPLELIELGESGEDAEPDTGDDFKKIRAHAQANNLSDDEAWEQLANSGEVDW